MRLGLLELCTGVIRIFRVIIRININIRRVIRAIHTSFSRSRMMFKYCSCKTEPVIDINTHKSHIKTHTYTHTQQH